MNRAPFNEISRRAQDFNILITEKKISLRAENPKKPHSALEKHAISAARHVSSRLDCVSL
jgi:hypothetical protein